MTTKPNTQLTPAEVDDIAAACAGLREPSLSVQEAEQEQESTLDRLRALLARYTQPCPNECEHSQCPLLRELHALQIKATLEKARLRVKPIVDRERAGEYVGDLMNMRLRASASTACDLDRAIEIVAATRQSSLWNRDGYDAALTTTIDELRAALDD